MKKEDAVATLLKNGATTVKNVHANGVSVNTDAGSLEKSYVTFQLDKPVKKLDKDGNEIEITKTTISLISVLGAVADVIGSSVKHHCQRCPEALETILEDSNFDIIQEKVEPGLHVNPFSESGKTDDIKKALYMDYLDNVSLSDEGKTTVKQIKMLRTLGPTVFGVRA